MLLSHHIQHLQTLNNGCLCIILGISLRNERRNTSIRAQAQQECIDTTLMQRQLCFLGHLARMDDHHMPKQLLLCFPARGSRPLGGPSLRWNDIICTDLHCFDAEDNWRQKTQDRFAWWQEVEDSAQTINSECETQVKEAKDKKKWRREKRSAEEADALVCPEEGCTFVARNTFGLANYCHQQHSLLLSVVCPHCQESFAPLGIKNHARRCSKK